MKRRFPARTTWLLVLAAAAAYLVLFSDGKGTGRARIEALLHEEQWGLAREAVEGELEASPEDSWLLEKAAELAFQVGDFAAGEARMGAWIQRSPQPAKGWLKLARLDEEAFRGDEMEAAAARAIQLDPELPGARAILARRLLATSRYDEARELLGARVEAGSAGAAERLAYGRALLRLGESCQAARTLGESVDDPEARLVDLCAQAEALIGCGRLEEAADRMAKLLEKDPREDRPYQLLGTALARAGRREQAREVLGLFKRLGKLRPRWFTIQQLERGGRRAQACLERARLHAETGEFHEAVLDCRQAAALDPRDGKTLLRAAKQLSDVEASGDAWKIAESGVTARMEPVADFLYFTGHLWWRAGKPKEAIRWFDRCLASRPGHPGATRERTAAVQRAAARAGSLPHLQAMLDALRARRDPFEALGPEFLALAGAWAAAGNPREEMKFLQLAREASPDLVDAHRRFAALVSAPDQLFIKAAALRDVLLLAPEDAAAARELARIHQRFGLFQDSRKEAQAR